MELIKNVFDRIHTRRYFVEPLNINYVNMYDDLNHVEMKSYSFLDPHHDTLMYNFNLIKHKQRYHIPRRHGKSTTILYMTMWEVETALEHNSYRLEIAICCHHTHQIKFSQQLLVELLNHNKITKNNQVEVLIALDKITITRSSTSIKIMFVLCRDSVDDLLTRNVTDVVIRLRGIFRDESHKKIVFDDTATLAIVNSGLLNKFFGDKVLLYG